MADEICDCDQSRVYSLFAPPPAERNTADQVDTPFEALPRPGAVRYMSVNRVRNGKTH